MTQILEIDLGIEAGDWASLGDDDALARLCERALGAALAAAGSDGHVSVLLTNDTQMHTLNKQWRGKDKPTDVLSFPADRIEFPFLGDIAVGFETSARDAAAMGKALPDHITHLLIHGAFHLLGHDHEDPAEAEIMEALEVKTLATLGLPDPYSDHTHHD